MKKSELASSYTELNGQLHESILIPTSEVSLLGGGDPVPREAQLK